MLSSRPLLSHFMVRGLVAFLLSSFCAAALAVSAQAAINPVPYVDIVTPVSITPGSTAPTLTVHGTGYVSGSSTVYWNGVALATTFVSAKVLTATVPTALVAAQGFGSVTVVTVAPGGGTSNVTYVPVASHVIAATFPAAASSTISVGSTPTGLATADFDGDGKVDLAIANGGSNTVSILMGNGDGTFTAKADVTAVNVPNWIVTGDFNGDGKADLAVANNGNNTVSILLGNGDGTFTLKSSPATGTAPYAVAAGDFNADGKLDLAVTNLVDSTVTILLGNGDGTFTAGTSPAVGTAPANLVVGDFNEDGVLDIVVANSSDNTVSMLLGNGDGTFQTQTTTAVGGSGFPGDLVAGDFNGDGHLDVAVTNVSDVAILLGNGAGVLSLNSNPSVGAELISDVIGDFNGDGKLDIIVTDDGLGGFVFPGNGDGTFGASAGFNVNAQIFGVVAADFNGDGALDVAFTNFTTPGNVTIFLQTLPVSLAPTSVPFGNQGINTSSGTETITLTNNSASTVNISGISVAGANASDFGHGTTCGPSVLPAGTCAITVTFTPAAIGAEVATLSVTDDADGSPQTLALSGTGVIFPQTIAKTFGAASIPLNGSTSLSFTITNSNAGTSLTNVAFTDTLPAGLEVASPNALVGSCGSGVISAVASSTSVSLSAATLAASGSCTFSLNITGISAGVQNNSVTSTSTEGGTGNTSNASLTVAAPPVLAKSFGAVSIAVGASTTLTFTVTNPSASLGLTGVAFTDNLPAGLLVSTPNGLAGTCGGGTITATAGASSAALAGATIGASGSCTFTVNVTGNAQGTLVNTTTAITSTNAGVGNTATASLMVLAPDLVITKTHTGNFQQGQTGAVYTISVSNTGNASTIGVITVVDTLPAGLTATAFSGTGWVCTVGTVTCTRADALAASGTFPPLTLTVNVSGTAAASLTNSVTVSGGGEVNLANDTFTNPTTVTTVLPDFSISAAPATQTVTAGINAPFTLTLTPLNNIPFSTPITLTASGLPAEATVMFQPPTVTPGNIAATDSMVVTTNSGVLAANTGLRAAPLFALGLPLAGIFLMGFGSRKGKWLSGRSRLWMVLLVICAGFAFWGCAGSPKGPATPAGTYTIIVTAEGGTVQHTTLVMLTVTQ